MMNAKKRRRRPRRRSPTGDLRITEDGLVKMVEFVLKQSRADEDQKQQRAGAVRVLMALWKAGALRDDVQAAVGTFLSGGGGGFMTLEINGVRIYPVPA